MNAEWIVLSSIRSAWNSLSLEQSLSRKISLVFIIDWTFYMSECAHYASHVHQPTEFDMEPMGIAQYFSCQYL